MVMDTECFISICQVQFLCLCKLTLISKNIEFFVIQKENWHVFEVWTKKHLSAIHLSLFSIAFNNEIVSKYVYWSRSKSLFKSLLKKVWKYFQLVNVFKLNFFNSNTSKCKIFHNFKVWKIFSIFLATP